MKRFLGIIIGLLVPMTTYAVSITDYGWRCTGFLYCGGSGDVVTTLSETIIRGVSTFIIALAVVVFFYGAIRMVVSQGEEGKEAGKKALIYAALGLVAALLTTAVVSFVRDYIYSLA